jgi:hypothetical protein
MIYILLSIFIFSNFLFSSEVQITGLKNKNPERVLYIGNSYLYYNDSLHNHVRRMLEEFYANKIDTSNYKLVTISGSRSWHHPFQLVIFQGGSGETDTASERKIFSDTTIEVINTIHKSGAEAALYMIHAYVEPHKNTNPKMIEDIKKMYIEAGNKNNALVIPVGIAFENAYKAQPDIVLHKPFDGSHPSLLGTYLASCVVFASITQQSPLEIDYNYYGEISNSDKVFLQEVAHKTVEDFYNIEL